MKAPAQPDGRAAVFEEHRSLLFGIAYRMLGSVADAEDVVQDAWLRWSAANRHQHGAEQAAFRQGPA
jgi:DNA-directed RNA polymerase specialized sigma24 family protein